MRNLGDQLGVSPRNMTAMVDELEDASLVVRQPHPTDRRATLVELTSGGRHEAEQVLGPRLAAIAELFDGFTTAEQEAFSTALGRWVRRWAAGRRERAEPPSGCALSLPRGRARAALTRLLPSVVESL